MTSERQHVVLYNPDAVFYTMPLALVAIGSHLDPEQYRVSILDGRLEQHAAQAVVEATRDALCLGVTVLTGAPIRDAVAISRAAKAARPDLPVIWGGWHASMFGSESLAEASVDVTVQAQGEETFAEIVQRLAEGRDLDGVAGCTWRAPDGTICRNPPRTTADINTFRPHNYDLLPVDRYFALKGKKQVDYISSQGCRFRCAFCADPFVYNRKWAGLEPERMAEELGALWHRWHMDDVNFQDETFFTYPERIAAVAEQFLARGLKFTWAATMRADQGDRMDDDVWALCKRSGLRRVLIGVESGSQEMMDRIKKDIKLEAVFASAEKCVRHGVAVQFPFIVGFPDEPDDSVAATIDVIRRLRSMSAQFVTPIFYFKPYPGTSITQAAVDAGYQLPCDLESWSAFDFVGSVGPWVSPAKYRLIERFKFYSDLAYGPGKPWAAPFRALARWRCERERFGFALEQRLSTWLRPRPRLA